MVALNGPVVGLPAALIAHADFIYASPQAFLLIPFASLGLAAEGGASRALKERLGIARAKEALLMGKRISSAELLACGFVNKIIPTSSPSDGANGAAEASFLGQVLAEVERSLSSQLNDASLLDIKEQFCRDERDSLDRTAVKEAYAAAERILAGVPREQLKRISKAKAKGGKPKL